MPPKFGFRFGISFALASTFLFFSGTQADAMQAKGSAPGFTYCMAEKFKPGGGADLVYITNVMAGRVEGDPNAYSYNDTKDNLTDAFERQGIRVFVTCKSWPKRKYADEYRQELISHNKTRRGVTFVDWSLPNGRLTIGARSGLDKERVEKPIKAVISSGSGGRPTPSPRPPTKSGVPEHEVRYQRELADYRRQVAEREAKLKAIEAHKKMQAAQLEASKRRTLEAMQAHEREVAKVSAAQRDYQQQLAEHQRILNSLNAQSPKDLENSEPVEWREAVSVCSLDSDNSQSRFGNWRCTGPLQFTYVKLGSDGTLFDTNARAQMSLTCGGSSASIRDLGSSGVYRVFGCSFGLHPTSSNGRHIDAAKKFGLGYIPGRRSYHCPIAATSCRTP